MCPLGVVNLKESFSMLKMLWIKYGVVVVGEMCYCPQTCPPTWPELFCSCSKSPGSWPMQGNASWPLSCPLCPLFQPDSNEDSSFLFGETQPFLSNSQPELRVRAAHVMSPPVHHQNGPSKKTHFPLFPCDFTFPVHLTFYCHPLFLSGPMSALI